MNERQEIEAAARVGDVQLVILAPGTRGDAQPTVALGLGLRAAGHDVRVATHREFEPLVREHGLDFAPLAGNIRELLQGEAGRSWTGAGRRPLEVARSGKRLVQPLVEALLEDCWLACQQADAIVCTILGFAGWHIAQRLGIPCVDARFTPFGLQVVPNLLAQRVPALARPLNRLNTFLGEQVVWQLLLRPTVNRWRQRTLGLPPVPPSGPFGRIYHQRVPHLFAFSQQIVPRPAHFPRWYHVTGYWHLDQADDWQPPAELEAFLADGPPPVYIGYGSMTVEDAAGLTELVLEALRRSGRRGIIAAGWAGLGQGALRDEVLLVESVPHDWLFPRMAAVVHHGGAGTTGTACRAGVPSIVTPLIFDQEFWGNRVATLGVGTRPIPIRQLTADRLADAIRQATVDGLMRDRAAALGQRLKAEDGVQTAVQVMQDTLRARAGAR